MKMSQNATTKKHTAELGGNDIDSQLSFNALESPSTFASSLPDDSTRSTDPSFPTSNGSCRAAFAAVAMSALDDSLAGRLSGVGELASTEFDAGNEEAATAAAAVVVLVEVDWTAALTDRSHAPSVNAQI
jgi:hypothetical protein